MFKKQTKMSLKSFFFLNQPYPIKLKTKFVLLLLVTYDVEFWTTRYPLHTLGNYVTLAYIGQIHTNA